MQLLLLTGRFTQEDTYRGDGLNLYAYCDNNPVNDYDPSGYSKKANNCDSKDVNKGTSNSDDMTRVGRWMSEDEYASMIDTGHVQESFSSTTHVANPANYEAYIKQTKPGNVYAEFDVPTSTLKQTQEG